MPEQKLQCYVSKATDILNEPWSMLILREFMIFGGTRRFEQLFHALGISRNVLTKRLAHFVELELIKKTPVAENGKRMEYKLKRKAWELSPVMLALHVWAEKWSEDDFKGEIEFVDIYDEIPLAPAHVTSQNGKKLDPDEVKVIPKTLNAKKYFETYRTMPSQSNIKNEAA